MSESSGNVEGNGAAAFGADLIIPALAVALTLYFFADSASLVWEARANGTVIGVALLAMVALQVARIAVAVREGRGTLGFGELGRWAPAHGKRLASLAILAAFVATIPWLGTTLGLFLAMMGLMAVLGVREPKILLAVAAATAGTVYLLFIAFLKTQLPHGAIENLLQRLFAAG